jgi:YebC/PmpR family DNA-binding regulatory protein
LNVPDPRVTSAAKVDEAVVAGARMSGHNRWSKIKHKKAAQGAVKGKVFSKLIREITAAARSGGGDAAGNARLRAALATAKEANMPHDNVERAVAKGTGALEGVHDEEVLYEGYGPSGVAMLVECLTDNRARTAADVRSRFEKGGGHLAAHGAVAWHFERCGVFEVKAGPTEDAVMSAAIEAGAEEVLDHGADGFEIRTHPGDVHGVHDALAKVTAVGPERLVYVPKEAVRVDDPDRARSVLRLVELLEDLDEVQAVHANFEIEEALLTELA